MAPSKKLLAAHKELLEFALSYPDAWQDEPWEGDVVAKVGKKVFVFFGTPIKDGIGVGVKLPHEGDFARSLPYCAPMGYGLGKWGWVSASFGSAEDVPVEMLKEWIDESYRAIAPKKLVKELDGR
jgi:predicted DNA-binding protein (MmcQ/YjbR family)